MIKKSSHIKKEKKETHEYIIIARSCNASKKKHSVMLFRIIYALIMTSVR